MSKNIKEKNIEEHVIFIDRLKKGKPEKHIINNKNTINKEKQEKK